MLQRCPVRRDPLAALATHERHLYAAITAVIAINRTEREHCQLGVRLNPSLPRPTKPDIVRGKQYSLFLVALIASHVQSAHMLRLISAPVPLVRLPRILISQVVARHIPVSTGLALSAISVRVALVLMKIGERLRLLALLADSKTIRSVLHRVRLARHSHQGVAVYAPTVPVFLAKSFSCVRPRAIINRTGTLRHVESFPIRPKPRTVSAVAGHSCYLWKTWGICEY